MPQLSELNMSLKEAYIEVAINQRKLSVAMDKLIPKDMNILNKLIPYINMKTDDIELSDEEREMLTSLKKLNRNSEILARSKASRIVALHRVLTNKGYRSPGVDPKSHPKTNTEYINLVNRIKKTMANPHKYYTSPLDRIYLLKTNKTNVYPNVTKPNKIDGDTLSKEKNLRPISIPTIMDRCIQACYYISYSVFSEHVADRNSYGFRPGRSPAWTIHSIAAALRRRGAPCWALEIDINKCFDSINHKFILNHTPFIPKCVINKWLTQGYILRGYKELGIFPTDSGIPQGGVISPTICNTVLDGMELFIRDKLYELVGQGVINVKNSGYKSLNKNSQLFLLYRYADDIVILTKSKFIALLCKDILQNFLDPRGLELSADKTHLTDLSGDSAYFEFVGYALEKRKIMEENKTKWFINIPDKNVKRLKDKVRKICKSKIPIEYLYKNVHIIMLSWTNFYRTVNASRKFLRIHSWLFITFYHALARRLKIGCKKMIINKSGKRNKIVDNYNIKRKIYSYINRKYLRTITYNKLYKTKWYILSRNEERNKTLILFSPKFQNIIPRSYWTKQGLNYFNPSDILEITKINLNYKTGVKKKVLKKNYKIFNKLTCPCCMVGLYDIDEQFEFHHILPVQFGGKNNEYNIIPLCKPCHNLITNAVKSKNLINCEEYLIRELLKLPENIINEFR